MIGKTQKAKLNLFTVLLIMGMLAGLVGQVTPVQAATDYVLDEFTTQSYSNNDGSVNWASNWVEGNDDDSATTGDVLITDGELRIGADGDAYIYRTVDLSTAASAYLTFDFRETGTGSYYSDTLTIEYSTDGTDYDTLATITNFSGSGSSSYSLPTGATTYIRFRITSAWETGEYVYLDDVRIEYTVPEPNPPLTASCGLDIVFVIDSSGSIGTYMNNMETAFQNFAAAFLPATPTRIAVVDFYTTARIYNFATSTWVASATTGTYWSDNVTAVNAAIEAVDDGGATNFDDALFDAHSLFAFDRDDYPDLIIFGTDGNPNRVGANGTGATEAQAMDAAVTRADAIKAAGIRILSIGIGTGIDTANLIAISGPIVSPPADITVTTDVITTNFTALADALAELVTELCGGTCTVYKVIDTDKNITTTTDQVTIGDGVAGWSMNVTSMSTGTTLVLGETNPDLTTTSGAVNFEFDIATGTLPATISIQETLKSTEWEFLDAKCYKSGTTPLTVTVDKNTGTVSGIPFTAYNDIVSCYFYNYPKPTYVDLISFTAIVQGQAIVLNWETATETDNSGFNLYRATSLDGERTKLNAELIPSAVPPGSTFGAAYEFVDDGVAPGVQYFYWLEDVDLAGSPKHISNEVDAYIAISLNLNNHIFLPVVTGGN